MNEWIQQQNAILWKHYPLMTSNIHWGMKEELQFILRISFVNDHQPLKYNRFNKMNCRHHVDLLLFLLYILNVHKSTPNISKSTTSEIFGGKIFRLKSLIPNLKFIFMHKNSLSLYKHKILWTSWCARNNVNIYDCVLIAKKHLIAL